MTHRITGTLARDAEVRRTTDGHYLVTVALLACATSPAITATYCTGEGDLGALAAESNARNKRRGQRVAIHCRGLIIDHPAYPVLRCLGVDLIELLAADPARGVRRHQGATL